MRYTVPGNNVTADLEFQVMDVESTTKSTFVDVCSTLTNIIMSPRDNQYECRCFHREGAAVSFILGGRVGGWSLRIMDENVGKGT